MTTRRLSRSAFAHRNFRLWFGGSTVSMLCDQFTLRSCAGWRDGAAALGVLIAANGGGLAGGFLGTRWPGICSRIWD